LRLDPSAPLAQSPFVLCWNAPARPLPLREVRGAGRGPGYGTPAPLWLDTGPAWLPFDFGARVRRLCGDIVARSEELRHIDLSRLLFAVTQARSGKVHGLQARVTPLRFQGGALLRRRRGITYQVQRYFVDNREMLYLVTFCLPRFLNLDFDEKFITLFHELYHISPAFDGDLRRHGGRYGVHSHSQRLYDKHMAALARDYLQRGADPAVYAFLRLNFAQLHGRHGRVLGVVVPRPKLIPVGTA
jgi:hypothetical protein